MKIFRITAFPIIIFTFYFVLRYSSEDEYKRDFKLHFPNGLTFKDYMRLFDTYKSKSSSDKCLVDNLVFLGNMMYLSLVILYLLIFVF